MLAGTQTAGVGAQETNTLDTIQMCLRYLDANGARYRHSTHPVAHTDMDAASAALRATHGMAKAVVFLDGRHPFLVIVPAGDTSTLRGFVP